MAMTNKQLAERAELLGQQLGRNPATSRLDKAELVALVAELEAEIERNGASDQSTEPPHPDDGSVNNAEVNGGGSINLAPQVPSPEPSTPENDKLPTPVNGADDYQGGVPPKETPKKEPPKQAKYYVAPGHSVPSRRGPLREMEEVRKGDFEPAVLRILIAKDCVIER